MPISDLEPAPGPPAAQKRKLDLLKQLDQAASNRAGKPDALESAIANYELAFRMQTTVPQLVDLATESEATQKLYGLDSDFAPTRVYARQCLLARRSSNQVSLYRTDLPRRGSRSLDQHGVVSRMVMN